MNFYLRNISWNEDRLHGEVEKFAKHLAEKLKSLKQKILIEKEPSRKINKWSKEGFVRKILEVYTKEQDFIVENLDKEIIEKLTFYRGKRHPLIGKFKRGWSKKYDWISQYLSRANFKNIIRDLTSESFIESSKLEPKSFYVLYKSIKFFTKRSKGTASEKSFEDLNNYIDEYIKKRGPYFHLNYKITELANDLKSSESSFIYSNTLARFISNYGQIFNVDKNKKTENFDLGNIIDKIVKIKLIENEELESVGISDEKKFKDSCYDIIVKFLNEYRILREGDPVSLDSINLLIDVLLALNDRSLPKELEWDVQRIGERVGRGTQYFTGNIRKGKVYRDYKLKIIDDLINEIHPASDAKTKAENTIKDYRKKYKKKAIAVLKGNERIQQQEDFNPWWAENLLENYRSRDDLDDYNPGEYSEEWHEKSLERFVELSIKQAGMMPTGDIEKHVEFAHFSIKWLIAQHHIHFDKSSSDPMDVILMGTLHKRLMSHVEPRKDPEYEGIMREMRDSFENIETPSIWNDKLEELYYERMEYIVKRWKEGRHIRILGFTRELLADFYKKGYITEEYIDKIIKDVESKLEERHN